MPSAYENDAPVPISQTPDETLEDRIEDTLLNHGAEPSQMLVDELERLAFEEATKRAAEILRRWLLDLKGTTAAVALQRVILGDGGESQRTAAARIGVTHTALQKAERKLRKKLKGCHSAL